MTVEKDDPFFDKSEEWKNQSSQGNITIYSFEKPYSLENENIIASEIDINCHGMNKEAFEQWKSLIIKISDKVENFENKVIFSSFKSS